MKNNHKDQQSQSTSGQKQNQTGASTKSNAKRSDEMDRQHTSKAHTDNKTNRDEMDYDNRNHDAEKNKNSKH